MSCDGRQLPVINMSAVEGSSGGAAQSHEAIAPASEASFHPSIGSPGDLVRYLPDDLLAEPAAAEGIEQDAAEGGASVTVTVPPASIHNVFAHRQWRAGMLLADLIHTSHAGSARARRRRPLVDLQGRRILELGCGTALPGIVAAHSLAHDNRPSVVVVSDYDEEQLMARLRRNVKSNLLPSPPASDGGNDAPAPVPIKVAGHIWGQDVSDLLDLLPSATSPRHHASSSALPTPTSPPAPAAFDLILLADCLWDALSHPLLLRTLSRTLARTPEARVHVVSGLHTGRETLVAFIRRARRQCGLVLKPWLKWAPELPSTGAGAPPESVRWCLQRNDEELNGLSGTQEQGEEDLRTELMLEMQLALEADPAPEPQQPPSPQPGESGSSTFVARGPRLLLTAGASASRAFVLQERPEERKEVGGVKERNRWMTFWSLGWSDEALAAGPVRNRR